MILLEVNGWGAFSNYAEFAQVIFLLLKIAGGTLLIFFFSLACLLFIGLNTVRQLILRQPLAFVGRSLIHKIAFLGGSVAALSFALLVTLVFQVSFWIVLIVSTAILFATQFLFRKAIFFLLIKRFGSYFLYLRSLRLIGQKFAYVFKR